MDGKDTTILRNRFRRALFAAATTGITQALWAAGPRIAFDIPASEFSQAIIQFYKQTNVEILYASPGSLGPVKTRAVAGELEVSEALTRMLEGTGYTFEFENPHSVLLKRADDGRAVVEAAQEPGWGPAQSDDAPLRLAEVSSANAPQAQDVVVTGTFIHGVLDIVSPLVKVDREQMKSTGYATVRDALMTLPFNSGAGPSDDYGGTGGNYNRGTAPNLRGLGYGATLVLINGRRQPLAGMDADFVDTSNIPWGAVERIEVLPDGSSALYGSDAIAGVINIIMREDLDGAETQGRFATALGGADETLISQMFGHKWTSGKFLFSYQYSQRGALAASDRYYTANADKRSLGGSDYRSIWGSPGNILDPNTLEAAFGIPTGQDGTALKVADLVPGAFNLHNKFAANDLTPQRKLHSAFFNASQQLNERMDLYVEGRVGIRSSLQRNLSPDQLLVVPATNAFFVDPFGGMPFVLVAYDFLGDLGTPVFDGETRTYDGTLGLKTEFGQSWRAEALVSYGRESLNWTERNLADPNALDAALADSDPATAFNPFGDGSSTNPATLEAIRTSYTSHVLSDMSLASIVLDGPLFSLRAGDAKLAIGAERRNESLHHRISENPPADFGRDISSAFAELSLPVIGNPDDAHSIPRVELSLAGRYESYSDFGNTFNPKIGLRWAPLEWAKFRTSWGTSFKAPKLLDLYDKSQNAAGMLLFPDPTSGSGQSLVLVRQGNNPGLKEETARTWTLGFDVMPASMRGLVLSLTYYDIDYEGRIVLPGPPSPFDILFQESQWAEVITRNPTQAQIDAVCRSPEFLGSPVDCANSAPAAIIDYRLRNLAVTKTRGFDLKVDYALDSRYGEFEFGLTGNYVLGFEQAFTRTAGLIDIVDTVGNPLALRLRANVEWSRNGRNRPGFNFGATVDHTGGYSDNEATAYRSVDAFTTLDLRMGYKVGQVGGWLNGVEIALNAVNVLDAAPPFINRSFGYDIPNADPTGRIVGLYTSKSW